LNPSIPSFSVGNKTTANHSQGGYTVSKDNFTTLVAMLDQFDIVGQTYQLGGFISALQAAAGWGQCPAVHINANDYEIDT
jgi:hypothetical protein